MSVFSDLVQPDKKVMSVENYFIYVCAWCCVQPGKLQPWYHGHSTEYDIAARGGIVFW